MIRELFDVEMQESQIAFQNLNIEDSKVYANWLAQSFYFVSHSTRLLALAAGKATISQESVHRRMIEHLTEEINHEKLALKDILNLGFKIEDFPELPETKAFYSYQYHAIQNENSLSFMGYILYLEGIACMNGKDLLNRTKKYTHKSQLFLKVHSEEDPDHLDKAFKLIENENALAEHLISNFQISASLYKHILQAVNRAQTRTQAEMTFLVG